jgi:hypothetical protein
VHIRTISATSDMPAGARTATCKNYRNAPPITSFCPGIYGWDLTQS